MASYSQWQMLWLGFAGLETLLLIIAFATGRAFYKFPLLFEDRSKKSLRVLARRCLVCGGAGHCG
jgi:hypothetical protein